MKKLTPSIFVALIGMMLIYACRKDLTAVGTQHDALVAKAKAFYTGQTIKLATKHKQLLSIDKQGIKASVRKKPIPLWENALVETDQNGKTLLTVPFAKYELDNKEMDYTRKFVFTIKNNQIVDGGIIEAYGAPALIKQRGAELITQKGTKYIDGFDGFIMAYDLNYIYKSGKHYRNGTARKGTAYVGTKLPDTSKSILKPLKASSLAKTAYKPDKKISGPVPVMEDGQNCEYYYWVYIERDEYGNITYWENLGYAYRICESTQDPTQPGGMEEYFIDCAGELNGTAFDSPCGCIGGSTGIMECDTDSLDAILKDTCLNATQMASLRSSFNNFLNGEGNTVWACIHKATYSKVAAAGKKIGFCINTITGNGTYNALNSTITYANELGLSSFITLRHEFFHVYQDTYYTGGTLQYNTGTRTGYPNIEFEQALFADILNGSDNASAMGSTASIELRTEYRNWVKSITNNNTAYPKQLSDLGGQYYTFLNKFREHAYGYDVGIVKTDLPPDALLNIFNSTNCK